MSWRSRVYRGWVAHRRVRPVAHGFRAPLRLVGLDLAELPRLLAATPWHGYRRSALVRFHRGDYFGDPDRDLADCLRDAVAARSAWRPDGRIELLTQLRCGPWCFNPVSFYLCRDRSDAVRAIVAEITNTPWNERHAYVLTPEQRGGDLQHQSFRFRKAFHISPFSPMEREYRWHFRFEPGAVVVHMQNRELVSGGRTFAATMSLAAQPASPARLVRTLVRRPFAGVQTLAAIYTQALRLWRKGATFHPHPGASAPRSVSPAIAPSAMTGQERYA